MTEELDTLWYKECVVCGEDIPITVRAFSVEPVCPYCGAVYELLHLDLVREGERYESALAGYFVAE